MYVGYHITNMGQMPGHSSYKKFAKKATKRRNAMSSIVYRGVHDKIRRGFREAEFPGGDKAENTFSLFTQRVPLEQ